MSGSRWLEQFGVTVRIEAHPGECHCRCCGVTVAGPAPAKLTPVCVACSFRMGAVVRDDGRIGQPLEGRLLNAMIEVRSSLHRLARAAGS